MSLVSYLENDICFHLEIPVSSVLTSHFLSKTSIVSLVSYYTNSNYSCSYFLTMSMLRYYRRYHLLEKWWRCGRKITISSEFFMAGFLLRQVQFYSCFIFHGLLFFFSTVLFSSRNEPRISQESTFKLITLLRWLLNLVMSVDIL